MESPKDPLAPAFWRASDPLSHRREQAKVQLPPKERAEYDAILAQTETGYDKLATKLGERRDADIAEEIQKRIDRPVRQIKPDGAPLTRLTPQEAREAATRFVDDRNTRLLSVFRSEALNKADRFLFDRDYEK